MRIPFGDSKGGGLYKLKSGRGYMLVAVTKSVNTLVFCVDDARWEKNGEDYSGIIALSRFRYPLKHILVTFYLEKGGV